MIDSTPGHFFDAGLCRDLALTPWGWREATVCAIDDLVVTAEYAERAGTVVLWHHEPIPWLEVGLTVQVHEEHHALQIDDLLVNVRVDSGLGPVPVPEHPERWADRVDAILINHATLGAIRIPRADVRRLQQLAQGPADT